MTFKFDDFHIEIEDLEKKLLNDIVQDMKNFALMEDKQNRLH